MKWSNFLASAVILTVVSVASADDFGRFQPTRLARGTASNPFRAPAADYYAGSMHAGSFSDYPAYPIGFTSYRGLGYWGTCCEKNPPCTENVWDGYCAQKGRGGCQKSGHCGAGGCGGCSMLGHGKLWSHFASKPDWCCYPQCCSSCCGGVGANWWPVTPKCRKRCHEPLSCKFRRLHDQCCGIFGGCHGDAGCGCTNCQAQHAHSPTMAAPSPTMAAPRPAAPRPTGPRPPEQVGPTPAEPTPQLPAPETSIDFSDELPPLSPQDKSARRMDLRRLPAVSLTY